VVRAPEGFAVTAASERAAVAAFEDVDRRLAGVQYHPEVGHSPHGQQVLSRFHIVKKQHEGDFRGRRQLQADRP
jgi:GMP synthase-like glutamine amidotransferase